jgi:hypothetical protein
MPKEEEQKAVKDILTEHPINFHFDSDEKYFPIDERQNNIEFLFRKYNHLKGQERLEKIDSQFIDMMDAFHKKFDQIATSTKDPIEFLDLGHNPDLDSMNQFVHDYSLWNMMVSSEITEEMKKQVQEVLGPEKYAQLSDSSRKEFPILSQEDISKLQESGLKFELEKIKIKDLMTPNNMMTCDAMTDKIAQGNHKNLGVSFSENVGNKPPLYYNLKTSEDGKKFVMQFGLTYPVNEGMTFPAWTKPLLKTFVKIAQKLAPNLYSSIKGTDNGKVGFHLEDRELGFYEGRIDENGKYIVEKAALTGHGPEALEVRDIGNKKDVDVYVGVGGHPHYFEKTAKINKTLEEIPILGAIPLVTRMVTKHGDHADGKGQTLKFDGSQDCNIRNWQ